MKIAEIGTSQRTCWQLCRAKHYHAFVMGRGGSGIAPLAEPLAPLFGRCGHYALQVWYWHLANGAHPEEACGMASEAVRKFVQEQRAEMAKAFGGRPPSYIDGDGSELTLVESFLNGYASYYADDRHLDIISIEWSFTIPAEIFYDDPSARDLPSCRGTIDLVFDTPDGPVIMDHKFNQYLETDLTSRASFWPQAINYARAAEVSFGKVAGFILNQIRKPTSLRPTNGESFDDFLSRIRSEYVSYPDYNGDYPRKRGYFLRSGILPILEGGRARRYLEEQKHLDREIVEAYAGMEAPAVGEPPPHIRRNWDACHRWGAHCEYLDLCEYGYNPATLAAFQEREEVHM